MRPTVVSEGPSDGPMVDGVAIRLADGKDWIVPPLRINQLLVHLPILEELSGMNQATPWAAVGKQRLREVLSMVLDAMQRNYPELTLGELQNLLDLRTVGPVIAAVLSQTLMPAVAQTEGKADG